MPFVGETGGVGAGQGMGEVPSGEAPADTAAVDRARAQLAQDSRRSIPLDPELQRRLDEARRAADRTRHRRSRGPRPRARRRRRDPAGASPGAAPAVTVSSAPRPSAASARCPSRTRSPATTCCSRCGSTSTSRARSTATSGRRRSRRRPTWSSSGRPARLAEDAAALRGRARRRGPRGRRAAPLARPPAGRARDAGPHEGRRGRSRTSTRSRAASRSRRRAGRTTRFEAAAAALDALLDGPGTLAERLAAEDARWTVPPERLTAPSSTRSCPATARGPRRHYPMPPDEDLACQLVHDQPWSGYNWYDGGYRSRVDFNLDLPVRLPSFVGHRRPRDVPRPPPRARPQGAGARRGAAATSRRPCSSSTRPSASSRRASRTSGASSSCRPTDRGPARGAGAGRGPRARRRPARARRRGGPPGG